MSATLAVRHHVMQGRNDYLFIFLKKGEEKVSHSCNIQIFPLNESLVSWPAVTFHQIFLKCTRSIQNLHTQLVLLSLWRLTNQACAETPVRIWEFCDSKEKKKGERARYGLSVTEEITKEATLQILSAH